MLIFINVFYTDDRKIKLAGTKFIELINLVPAQIINRLCLQM